MLERLERLLQEYNYKYTIKHTDFNTHIRIGEVNVIVCENGYILNIGDDYDIAHSPYNVIDLLQTL